MELPLPHSHGTAVQYIDPPGQYAMYTCPDVDTCDQDTNPACLPGSLNYPPGGNPGFSPFNPSQPIGRNPRREARCSGPNPPYYCTVEGVPCEGTVEVLAYYDGSATVRAEKLAGLSRYPSFPTIRCLFTSSPSSQLSRR